MVNPLCVSGRVTARGWFMVDRFLALYLLLYVGMGEGSRYMPGLLELPVRWDGYGGGGVAGMGWNGVQSRAKCGTFSSYGEK